LTSALAHKIGWVLQHLKSSTPWKFPWSVHLWKFPPTLWCIKCPSFVSSSAQIPSLPSALTRMFVTNYIIQFFNNLTTPYIYSYSSLQFLTSSYIFTTPYNFLQPLTAPYIFLQLTVVSYRKIEIEQTLNANWAAMPHRKGHITFTRELGKWGRGVQKSTAWEWYGVNTLNLPNKAIGNNHRSLWRYKWLLNNI